MTDVILTRAELTAAAVTGIVRQIESVLNGLPDRHGYDGDGWNLHIEGAAGEMAVAKLLNRYWAAGVNTFRRPDVGQYQVRCRSRHDYELIVRVEDDDNSHFVLVTGKAPNYRVRGYIQGKEAKRPEWLQTYGGREAAYFVPHSALRQLGSPPA